VDASQVPGAVSQPPRSVEAVRPRPGGAAPRISGKFEANLMDQAKGGQGTSATSPASPAGCGMSAYEPIEFIVTPDITMY
jgi:hypothetical protein